MKITRDVGFETLKYREVDMSTTSVRDVIFTTDDAQMSHTIEQIDHHWAGETLHLLFSVYDEDNNDYKDLTGATIEWWLSRFGDTVLDQTDVDVTTEITDPLNGEARVMIDAGATDELAGKTCSERLRIEDADGIVSIFGTTFTVDDPR